MHGHSEGDQLSVKNFSFLSSQRSRSMVSCTAILLRRSFCIVGPNSPRIVTECPSPCHDACHRQRYAIPSIPSRSTYLSCTFYARQSCAGYHWHYGHSNLCVFILTGAVPAFCNTFDTNRESRQASLLSVSNLACLQSMSLMRSSLHGSLVPGSTSRGARVPRSTFAITYVQSLG